MLLIYIQKITPRITYIFKHICTRVLGIEVGFTSVIEEFIAHSGAKLSYGKQSLGNEFFIQSQGLLTAQGFESVDIVVKTWEETTCFFLVSEKSTLPFDIFAAGFYLMSRYEEYLPHVKDAMGRYPALESLAYKEGFLQQPVVDIWAYKFKKILSKSFPTLVFPKQTMTIHSIVEARQPFAYIQKGFFRSVIGFGRDLFKFRLRKVLNRIRVLSGFRKDPYDTFTWLINNAKNSSNKLSVFFLLGDPLFFEESINTQRKKFKMLVKYVADYTHVGLMLSFAALTKDELLKAEKQRMEDITNRTLLETINAQYLVNLPDIYRNLVALEIEKDFTMVYEDVVGFRAGTCTPFLFYDLDYEIKTPLIIQPIALTTQALRSKHDSEINKLIASVIVSVKAVNGTFSMIFTNKDFTVIQDNKVLRNLFSEQLQ